MPIEIRELTIKATILEPDKKSGSQPEPDKKEQQQIVQQCVDQVLEIIRNQKER
jgi:hypothetical protein